MMNEMMKTTEQSPFLIETPRLWLREMSLADKASIACRAYGFRTLRFDALYSIIRDTNQASRRVALRNGMSPVDTFVKHYRGVDMPHVVYRVTREETF